MVRSRDCERDLDLIFGHLIASYEALGDAPQDAFERAAARLRGIGKAMEGLGGAPFRGSLRSEIAQGLRQLTLDRTIFYFRVDEEAGEVRVLAIFFSGQDHLKHMVERLRPLR